MVNENLFNEKGDIPIKQPHGISTNSTFSLLVVGTSWPPETFLNNLIKGLLSCGIHITVACTSRPEFQDSSIPAPNWLHTPSWENFLLYRLARLGVMAFKAICIDTEKFLHIFSLARNYENGKNFLKTFYQWLPFIGGRWDIIYFPWNSGAITYVHLFDWDIPIVVSCRGSQVQVAPHNPQRAAIRKGICHTFERASGIHTVCKAIEMESLEYGLDPAKSKIIHPAVDSGFFKPLPPYGRKPESHTRIISIGSLIWVKGYEYALMAIRELLNRGQKIEYLIIGEGHEHQRILYTICDLGLEKHVQLLGKRSPQEVCQLLQKSDIYLLSSLSEGISNAALEAMACGLPIVTTDCGGMEEAVTDGVEGYVVPVRNPQRMAQALEALVCDNSLRAKMGVAARQKILQKFIIGEQIAKFADFFRGVINSKL